MICIQIVMNEFINKALEIPGSSFPCGLVKHGYISGANNSDGSSIILLDIHNNKGFSGSPICCYRDNGFKIIGVISGFYFDMFDSGIQENSNSGIAYGLNIKNIKQTIESIDYSRL